MYGSNSFSGFGAEKPNPWRLWAQKIASPLPKQLFQTLAQQQPATVFAKVASNLELRAWIRVSDFATVSATGFSKLVRSPAL